MTFFSGTDTGCLHDNAENFPFLLSLIVNLEGDYKAKIAFIGQREQASKGLILNTRLGNLRLSLGETKNEDVLILCECNIVFEQEDYVIKRYDTLLKKAQTPKYPAYGSYKDYRDYSASNYHVKGFNSWDQDSYTKQTDLFAGLDLNYDKVDTFLIKLLNLDETATDLSLYLALKRLETKSNDKDFVLKIYEDLIEDNFEKFAESHWNTKDLSFDQLSEIADKAIRRINVFKEIQIGQDVAKVIQIFENEFYQEHYNGRN